MSPMCRKEIQDYLQCRMTRGLMVPEPMSNFGFPDQPFVYTPDMRHRVSATRINDGSPSALFPRADEVNTTLRSI